MPGPTLFVPPRRARRGAALTLVFMGALAAGAATAAWGAADGRPARPPAGEHGERQVLSHAAGRSAVAPRAADRHAADRHTVDRRAVEAAAERAVHDGKSGSEAAAELLSRSGDAWSAVYTPREYEGFALALDGAYVGVGLTTRRAEDGRMEVDGVRPGGPAERAGIAPGDRLLTVDGADVTGRPVTEVVSLLRGDGHSLGSWPVSAPGTTVRLGLQRGAERWERTLRRERLVTESVEVEELSRGAAGTLPATLIKVSSFTRGTGERVRAAVREAAPGEGILLDLRGNSGGLVAEAVTAASAFLDGGLVATYDVRGSRHVLRAEPGGDTRRPLVVLVDGGTMSAAELLTGALQDRGRTVVVGSRTFGKGSVQMPSRLADGSVAELTVGHYRTPAGRAVDGAGITPDLAVQGPAGDGGEKDAEARGRRVLSGLGGGA
ncbi:PDZ domain-containing protein [Streptomyces luteoverticillatus]|uniref:PDZ domain-containing protein n=1 Tax=Streptomyces luteoverticillatus TaxID=66425 RepID=A0A3Q9FZ32_STRLT|nr:S41 family peptidase [Streptomyces luteoverticillatus]AZQ71832.1 PDZ domain-containing protein [Streptomyces luteoverticillatus]